MSTLTRRWPADGGAAAPDASAADLAAVGTDLVARWSEPHRRYHDTVHLAEVLAAVDVLCRAGRVDPTERTVAVLGAWFHDAVYAVGGEDNERRSAALAATNLGGLGASPDLVDAVVTVVLDTEDHAVDGPASPAREVLHDADLWVLSAPTDRFDAYCAQVRDEFRDVPAVDYARGRTAVLRPFLVREHVYRTGHARREWEPSARENLARELTRLAG